MKGRRNESGDLAKLRRDAPPEPLDDIESEVVVRARIHCSKCRKRLELSAVVSDGQVRLAYADIVGLTIERVRDDVRSDATRRGWTRVPVLCGTCRDVDLPSDT
jgi:hypothetical protein